MKLWIFILIACRNVINICQGANGFVESKSIIYPRRSTLDIRESRYVQNGGKSNEETIRIKKPRVKIDIKTHSDDDNDASLEYEMHKDDLKPFIMFDLSEEDSNEIDGIEDDDDDIDDEDGKSRRKRESKNNDPFFSQDNKKSSNDNSNVSNAPKAEALQAAQTSWSDEDDDDKSLSDDIEEAYDKAKQLTEDSDDPYCSIIERSGQACLSCRNPDTGAKSESCSYTFDQKPKGFSYKRKRNYDDDDDEDDDENKRGRRRLKKANYRLHPTEFHPRKPPPLPIIVRQKPKKKVKIFKKIPVGHYEEYELRAKYPKQYTVRHKHPEYTEYEVYDPHDDSYHKDAPEEIIYHPIYKTIQPRKTKKKIIKKLVKSKPKKKIIVEEHHEHDDDDDDDQLYYGSSPSVIRTDHIAGISTAKNKLSDNKINKSPIGVERNLKNLTIKPK